ncbi:LuxR family transcriptional regulator [Actinomadura craniellae]|uniref:LuxR family transcriptional regulator n=1 Tax=Actinomadura craniellae TaxID=2231787 RepID=A0A365HC48_9ACTN|nr:LuxR family transcriptional regulator [Actinomadura craniellae]RAY16667.1 LuxR family transcriptional regulator [Actinomadura craniellae]
MTDRFCGNPGRESLWGVVVSRTDRRTEDLPPGPAPLVGRRDALDTFEQALDTVGDGGFRFLALVGEPGAGKTRLLIELSAAASGRKLPALAGRAAEFEQDMPFGVVIDAIDDHLEESAPDLGPGATRLLGSVFPALSAPADPAPDSVADSTSLARYRLFRTVRQLLEELAGPSGLVVILDDLHWADDTSVELIDHLVRHPPRAGVLLAVSYRPAQASPRLATLVEAAGPVGVQVPVRPLTEAEAAELLGPKVSRARVRALFEASGGNPFYLEALARMDGPGSPDGMTGEGELPGPVRAALQVELSGLPPAALKVAQAAAVTADEFEPALAAVAAEVTEDAALAALDELVARDVVRPAGGRFRFRHPLVRHAAYESAAAGWRVGVHARVAAHLAELGVPATVRARHVEGSARFGDAGAILTLVEAAGALAPRAPTTAARWLKAALKLMPDDVPERVELLLKLAQAQALGGQLEEGVQTARDVLSRLPLADLDRRARAARLSAMMERLLDRPQKGRALLLAELRQMPDPRSAPAVMLRLRLVADSLMRVDYRAAQAVLDLVPGAVPEWDREGDGWDPSSLPLAIAALRPMPAYAAGAVAAALAHVEAADALLAAAPDAHLAEWMDAVTWLCWAELFMGRYPAALRRLDRALSVARTTGQSYIVTTMLSGQARGYGLQGRLAEAAIAAEEAMEVARMLNSGQALVIALAQRALVASWSGEDADALAYAEEAVRLGGHSTEWWGNQARYAHGVALVNAGRADEGTRALYTACNDFDSPLLDPGSVLSACELLATAEPKQALAHADRAAELAHAMLDTDTGSARLARAHAVQSKDPAAAAEHALAAAAAFTRAGQRVDAGRARLRAGTALAAAGDRARARAELGAAAETFAACGADALHAQAQRERRRLGVRVGGAAGRGTGPHGLSKREFQVAQLVAEGYTNQQVAEKLFLSIRTVETHLSHIFAKLGVGSRVGVVTALGRPDTP